MTLTLYLCLWNVTLHTPFLSIPTYTDADDVRGESDSCRKGVSGIRSRSGLDMLII
jgi:hypothetical protein